MECVRGSQRRGHSIRDGGGARVVRERGGGGIMGGTEEGRGLSWGWAGLAAIGLSGLLA